MSRQRYPYLNEETTAALLENYPIEAITIYSCDGDTFDTYLEAEIYALRRLFRHDNDGNVQMCIDLQIKELLRKQQEYTRLFED